MRNVIGVPARGESFFPRDREVLRIVTKLDDGNNLNIAAPRRVGKTSILLHLLDQKKGGYIYIYVDTEDIKGENDFFKRIVKEVLKTEEIRTSRRLKHFIESGHKFLSKVKAIKIMGNGIDFAGDDTGADYKEDLINLLSGIELEKEKGVVILIDEFPQTVQNIIDSSPNDENLARTFLQANREIRLNPNVNSKVRFILTGSIGLNHTVAKIGATAFINDLNSIEIGSLTREEGELLLKELLLPKRITLTPASVAHLLKKIEWLIPFHVQLAVQEILAKDIHEREVDDKVIDEAFDAIVQMRNENHFDHYYSRLKRQFKENEFSFADEVLVTIAEKGLLSKGDIFNLSVKYELEQKWKNILDILVYDGYINNNREDHSFTFNSPIVRMWWQRFICK